MNMAKRSGLLEAALSTKSWAPFVGYSTETSCPGPLVPLCGVVSSLPGAELVAGLLLISLFAGALLIPFERLIPAGTRWEEVITLYQHRLTKEEKLWWYGKGAV